MGFFDKIRGEFIDIIEFLDPNNDSMIHRFERYGNEIKNNAKLVVRESQVAVFINEGQVADVFKPGTYTLNTQNLPILTTLKGWKYGFNSPFKAEVYFVNTKNFIDLKWGTKNPIIMRDTDFGIVRVRAFGNYAMRITEPVKFILEIAGTDGTFTTDEVHEQLRTNIMTRFADILGESKIPVLDFAANYNEFSDFVSKNLSVDFKEYGLEITKFLIENISLPPAVEEAIDKRSSMGAVGNLDAYTKFQTAQSMEAAAANETGTAGAGIGMGMGFAMANQMAQGMMPGQQQQQNPQQGQQTQGATPPPIPGQVQFFVAQGGQQTGPFTLDVLKNMISQKQLTPESLVWKEGMAQWTAAGQVEETKTLFGAVPPPLPPQ